MSNLVPRTGRRAGRRDSTRSIRPTRSTSPFRSVLVTATLALVAGLLVPGTAPSAAAGAATARDSSYRAVGASFDSQVLHWTNVARKKRGLRPLRAAVCPKRFAYGHTKRMASRDRMYHQRLRPVLRKCRARTVGENVAWGSSGLSGRQVVRRWLSSDGHRANILSGRYRYLGVDAWRSDRTGRVYVGQVFGG